MRLYFLVFLLLSTAAAHAAGPVITSVSNASGSDIASTGNVIYGGLAGEDCSSGAVGPCNNCTTAYMALSTCTTQPLCTCNTARIYDGLTLTINVTPPTGVTDGELKMMKIDGGVNTIVTKIGGNNNTFASFDWTTICNAAGGNTCANLAAGVTSATYSFTGRLFVDKPPANDQIDSGEETTDVSIKIMLPTSDDYGYFGLTYSEGVGGTSGFYPYPGDEKIYMTELETSTGYPNFTYGGKARALRVFYSENGLASATVDGSSKDITLDDAGDLGRNTVTGLTNDTTYVFRIALVDQAQNVLQFFNEVGAGGGACDNAPDFDGCPWKATPEKVLGLLTDDVNCFIATAAFGTSLGPKLETFRAFRNQYLLTNSLGRAIVDAYYEYGPKAAKVIRHQPVLRAITQAGLWPVYIFSWTALNWGLGFALLAGLTIIFAMIATVISLRRFFAGTL